MRVTDVPTTNFSNVVTSEHNEIRLPPAIKVSFVPINRSQLRHRVRPLIDYNTFTGFPYTMSSGIKVDIQKENLIFVEYDSRQLL